MSLKFLPVFCLFTVSCAVAQDGVQPAAPKSLKEKASYAIGQNIGNDVVRQFNSSSMDLDMKAVARGFAVALLDQESELSVEELKAALTEFSRIRAENLRMKAEKNIAAGLKFLEDNKTKKGVKVTESGLQYLVLKEGSGPSPTREHRVTTHYKGSLTDGTIFDGSYKGDAPTAEDEPISFPVTGVIKGWTEALQLMNVGAKYRLFIPADLAYGAQQRGEHITPNSVLIFDLELLSFE